ncbi:hypothetical protein PpBr36_05456 [Pyricularia pennisetigena]|uniref:hypothetical protein n=1 Tax=Pyricularia pennisetigena TaxID=1578925 RepID=UPI001152CF74|nr:hypothetical protein PpBr36_05456 [Pyricularia pennisetigena]TLS26666.1 hypothetical protein PpBr36_05456 [Pyricularia pennisetigena]
MKTLSGTSPSPAAGVNLKTHTFVKDLEQYRRWTIETRIIPDGATKEVGLVQEVTEREAQRSIPD